MVFALAHLSDPHLAPLPAPRWRDLIGKRLTGYINWHQRRRFIHDPAVLAKIITDLHAQAPDHIAVTGDIVNIALKEEFERGLKWLQRLGSLHDVSLVPGNHDTYVPKAVRYAPLWAPYMTADDGAVGFPFVRRRGPLALIGLSTAVATPLFMATGRLGPAQLARLDKTLAALADEKIFRVVLIHHPPVSLAKRHKLLTDSAEFQRVIAAQGAELVLHGHDHHHVLNWLPGPNDARVPAVGVPSASAAPGTTHDSAAYNLYAIDGAPGTWRCEMTSHGINSAGEVMQQRRIKLLG
jgi:3',5'-cyclic AMP phosphodiesterase CpdA